VSTKIIFEDNQKPFILEVTIIIALFLVSINQISLRKITSFSLKKTRK